jgi:hypothetical protein
MTSLKLIRGHRAHLKELREMENTKEVRRSKYFVMKRSVHRRQKGRGSRFQNHKVTDYIITSAMSVWDSAWSPSGPEVSKVINADVVRDNGWVFKHKKDADKAWLLLMIKYSD